MSSQSGNTKDSGNKGNNRPWQAAVLKLLGAIASGSGGAPIVRTPTMVRTGAAGTILAGKKSVSFFNGGATNATVLGAALKPGEEVSFSVQAPSDTLTAFPYDGTGTDLLITTLS